MARYQVGERLKAADKRVTGIRRALAALPPTPLKDAFRARYGDAFHLAPEPDADAPRAPEPNEHWPHNRNVDGGNREHGRGNGTSLVERNRAALGRRRRGGGSPSAGRGQQAR